MVKNPPVSAEDIASTSDPGRPHMPWSSEACVQQQSPTTMEPVPYSLGTTATEPTY